MWMVVSLINHQVAVTTEKALHLLMNASRSEVVVAIALRGTGQSI